MEGQIYMCCVWKPSDARQERENGVIRVAQRATENSEVH